MQTIHRLPIAASLEEACYPRRLALLIYDMQVGICQQVSCGRQSPRPANGSAIVAAPPAFRWPTAGIYRCQFNGWALSRPGWQWHGNALMIRPR
jgi:hypothetical protein